MSYTTQNYRDIKASPEEIYGAFTSPEALVRWQAPGDMTAKVHHFDLRPGGGYRMSLFYPGSEREMKGKTADREDRFTARFVELIPNEKIVEAISFDSSDPAFAGEMIMEVRLDPVEGATRVTIAFGNIPNGIRPEDNEAGTASSLEKLAAYLETHSH